MRHATKAVLYALLTATVCCGGALGMRDGCLRTTARAEAATQPPVADSNASFVPLKTYRAVEFSMNRDQHVNVLDRMSQLSVLYDSAGYFPAYRPRNTSSIRYTVDCTELTRAVSCDMFHELTRLAFAYAVAWLNVGDWPGQSDDSTYNRIELQHVPYERYLRDPYGTIEVRFVDFMHPRPSVQRISYDDMTPLVLGLASIRTVDLSVGDRWFYTDLDTEMAELRGKAGLRFNEVYARERGRLLARAPRRCDHSLMLVLLHEVWHALNVGHASAKGSLMYYQSPGWASRVHDAASSPEFGGVDMLPHDVYRLRYRWGRSNVYVVREFVDRAGLWAEFGRLMQEDGVAGPATSPTSTASTTAVPVSTPIVPQPSPLEPHAPPPEPEPTRSHHAPTRGPVQRGDPPSFTASLRLSIRNLVARIDPHDERTRAEVRDRVRALLMRTALDHVDRVATDKLYAIKLEGTDHDTHEWLSDNALAYGGLVRDLARIL